LHIISSFIIIRTYSLSYIICSAFSPVLLNFKTNAYLFAKSKWKYGIPVTTKTHALNFNNYDQKWNIPYLSWQTLKKILQHIHWCVGADFIQSWKKKCNNILVVTKCQLYETHSNPRPKQTNCLSFLPCDTTVPTSSLSIFSTAASTLHKYKPKNA